MSNSASVSSFVGSVMGFRNWASSPLLRLPFTHWVVKLKAIKRDYSRWSLRFSISSRCQLLSIGTSRLWSVRMWKCLNPSKNTLHFATAHTTASSFSFIVAYHDSASERNREVQSSTDFCWRINPSPCLLASVVKRVGLVLLKKDRIGGVVRDFLILENAPS